MLVLDVAEIIGGGDAINAAFKSCAPRNCHDAELLRQALRDYRAAIAFALWPSRPGLVDMPNRNADADTRNVHAIINA